MTSTGQFLPNQFAQALGITKKTLFQYERDGVLPPARRQAKGKLQYRFYTTDDLVSARKALGIPPPLRHKRRQLFMNLKGGVGKSVLSYNYGYCIAKLGIRTLLIDLDAQAHLTTYAGFVPEECKHTLYHVLLEDYPVDMAVRRTSLPTLDIIPSNLTLSPLELSLFNKHAREYRLKRVLEPLFDQYQVVIFDAPPNLSLLNVNALLTTDDLIVPVMADFFSYEGLRLLFESLAQFRRDLNHEHDNVYVVLNGYNATESVARQSKTALEQNYREFVTKTVIRKSTVFTKSTAAQQSVLEFEPGSKAAEDIKSLVCEILEMDEKGDKKTRSRRR